MLVLYSLYSIVYVNQIKTRKDRNVTNRIQNTKKRNQRERERENESKGKKSVEQKS